MLNLVEIDSKWSYVWLNPLYVKLISLKIYNLIFLIAEWTLIREWSKGNTNYTFIFIFADTDKMFGGKSAFPKSDTIVTGLKYKDKYPGHKQPKSWPEQVYSMFD